MEYLAKDSASLQADGSLWSFPALACVSLALLLVGCSSLAARDSNSYNVPTKTSNLARDQRPPAFSVAPDDEEMRALWQRRVLDDDRHAEPGAFLLGPGDILLISVPLIGSLSNRTVLVSETNTISLPLIGEINLAGMSEDGLREELKRRLERYMYHPEVEVFLKRSEDREVAVLGAVAKPGRYALTSKSDTLMTMISRAGGLDRSAATRVILIPESTRRSVALKRQVAAADEQMVGTIDAPAVSKVALEGEPPEPLPGPFNEFIINLTNTSDERYLELPARPGDTLIIPTAGDVTVKGWVNNPGAFPITSGMTVLSAIAAAGGAEFSSSATLVRERENGKKIELSLDLSTIEQGSEADIPVQGGDIVTVNRSVVGLIPYSLYFILKHTGFGLYPPIP